MSFLLENFVFKDGSWLYAQTPLEMPPSEVTSVSQRSPACPTAQPLLWSSSPSWLPPSWVSRIIRTSRLDEICPSNRQPFPPPVMASTLLQKPSRRDVPFPSLSLLLQVASPWLPQPSLWNTSEAFPSPEHPALCLTPPILHTSGLHSSLPVSL